MIKYKIVHFLDPLQLQDFMPTLKKEMHTLIQDCFLLKLKFHQKRAGEGNAPRDHPLELATPLFYTHLWDDCANSLRNSVNVCFLCLHFES